jgi:hypothetical protein
MSVRWERSLRVDWQEICIVGPIPGKKVSGRCSEDLRQCGEILFVCFPDAHAASPMNKNRPSLQ